MTKDKGTMKPLVFVLSALFGTGAALLFAPESGKETRERIGGFAGDVKDRAQCYAMHSRDKLTGYAKDARHYFAGRKSLVAASFDAGRKAYVAERERLTRAH